MKREKRRENVKTEEEFDSIYKAYEKKLLKRLKIDEEPGHALSLIHI